MGGTALSRPTHHSESGIEWGECNEGTQPPPSKHRSRNQGDGRRAKWNQKEVAPATRSLLYSSGRSGTSSVEKRVEGGELRSTHEHFIWALHPSVIVYRAAPARRSSYLLPCTGYLPRLICRESEPCHRTALTGIQLPHSLTDHFE
ncbi:unnamed protein product [Arctogadus glacialis]